MAATRACIMVIAAKNSMLATHSSDALLLLLLFKLLHLFYFICIFILFFMGFKLSNLLFLYTKFRGHAVLLTCCSSICALQQNKIQEIHSCAMLFIMLMLFTSIYDKMRGCGLRSFS